MYVLHLGKGVPRENYTLLLRFVVFYSGEPPSHRCSGSGKKVIPIVSPVVVLTNQPPKTLALYVVEPIKIVEFVLSFSHINFDIFIFLLIDNYLFEEHYRPFCLKNIINRAFKMFY